MMSEYPLLTRAVEFGDKCGMGDVISCVNNAIAHQNAFFKDFETPTEGYATLNVEYSHYLTHGGNPEISTQKFLENTLRDRYHSLISPLRSLAKSAEKLTRSLNEVHFTLNTIDEFLFEHLTEGKENANEHLSCIINGEVGGLENSILEILRDIDLYVKNKESSGCMTCYHASDKSIDGDYIFCTLKRLSFFEDETPKNCDKYMYSQQSIRGTS